jgi:hypothetical protein
MNLIGQMYQREPSQTWEDAFAKTGSGFARNPHLAGLAPSACHLHPADFAALGCPATIQAGPYTVPTVPNCPPGRGYIYLVAKDQPDSLTVEFAQARAEFAGRVEALVTA